MLKQTSILSMIVLGIVLIGSSGYLFANKPATSDSIHKLKIEELSRNPLTLRLSGGSMDSSRRVGKIVKKKDGDSLLVTVYLTLGKGTGTGHFSETMVIDDSTNKIRFGPEKKVIWERDK